MTGCLDSSTHHAESCTRHADELVAVRAAATENRSPLCPAVGTVWKVRPCRIDLPRRPAASTGHID